jgi:hypothetical protein
LARQNEAGFSHCTGIGSFAQSQISIFRQAKWSGILALPLLGEFIAHGLANLIIALAVMAIGGGEALDIRDRFNVPNDDVGNHQLIQQTRRSRVHKGI